MHRQVVASFEELAPAFAARMAEAILCSAASVDGRGRPRSRVLHPVWEGAVGWVTTRRSTPKIRHLATNPHLSLAFVSDPFRPVYVECHAVWDGDLVTRERIWALCRSLPAEQGGFEPAETWGVIADEENGLLRLSPWRIELNDFRGPPQTLIWERADADT
jgi:hypothetical protein